MIVIANIINLLAGLYFFFLATVVLVTHNNIKHEINKDKKLDREKVTDKDLYILGGLFAYFTVYFFWSFGHMTFFGFDLK